MDLVGPLGAKTFFLSLFRLASCGRRLLPVCGLSRRLSCSLFLLLFRHRFSIPLLLSAGLMLCDLHLRIVEFDIRVEIQREVQQVREDAELEEAD